MAADAHHLCLPRPCHDVHLRPSKAAHEKEEQQMSRLIPQDIETFLYELGTLKDGTPSAFEQYVKAAAALLWEKYVIFEDASIQILQTPPNHSPFGVNISEDNHANVSALQLKPGARQCAGMRLRNQRSKINW